MKKFFCCMLSALTIIFFAACSNEPVVDVIAAKVIAADGSAPIVHDGKISLSDSQKVFAKVSGNVISTYFERGGDVEEGQALFKIGSHQEEEELLKARANLGESMTALARAVAEKNSDVESRRAEVDERKAIVRQLEEKSAAGIVHSPKTGKIDVETIQLGAKVTANETVLANVGKSNPIAVRFEISDEEKNFLLSGDKIKIALKLSDGSIYPHEGKMNFVDGSTIEATFPNDNERLNLDSAAQVVIEGVKIPNAFLIPESAVQHRDDGDFVFIVDSNKKAVSKKISLGGKIGTYVIVNNGLTENDSVVVEDLTNLREGTPLSVTNDK